MQQQTHARPLTLVCVAAPKDAALLTRWETHLHPLRQAGLISVWSELHLAPGADRAQEQQQHLDHADVVLLLLSASFFDSPDCLTMMDTALQRSRTGTLRVIPLLLRSVALQESPLGKLTPWPSNGKPIMLWRNQDEGWHACVQELRRLLGRRVSEALSSERPPKHADPDHAPSQSASTPPSASQRRKLPLYRRKIVIIPLVFIVIIVTIIALSRRTAVSNQLRISDCPSSSADEITPSLGGYATSDTKEVVYVDKRHYILQLYTGGVFGSKWYYADLHGIAGFTSTCNSTLAAYASSINNVVGQRIVYIDINHSIHMLSTNKSGDWQDTNLTEKTHFPQAGSQAIISYDWPAAGTTEIFYINSGGHIQELLSPPPGDMWNQNDLTDITGASAISPIPSDFRLTGYGSSDRAQEILYTDPNGDIQELRLELGKRWSHRNLSQFPTNAPPAVTSTIAGYDWPLNGTEQIIYLDKQHHLQELSAGQNSSWKITDLTQLTALFPINPLPASFSLAGFIWSKNNLQEVVYVDGRSHIQELSSGPDNRWKTTDLTQRSNAPLAGSGAISGYDWTQMGSVQIVYRDRIGHIEELSSSQKDLWLQKDLTQASGLH